MCDIEEKIMRNVLMGVLQRNRTVRIHRDIYEMRFIIRIGPHNDGGQKVPPVICKLENQTSQWYNSFEYKGLRNGGLMV